MRSEGRAQRWDLSSRLPQLRLEPGGFRWILRSGRTHHPLVLYSDLTHLSASARGLWIGTRRGILFLRRQRFRDPAGPERLARELVRRIAAGPDGMRQLERMAEVQQLAASGGRVVTTLVAAALCLALYWLELSDPLVQVAAAFDRPLVLAGEWWRVASANLAHAVSWIPVHLGLNLLGLLGFGFLVERALGPTRCAALLGLAGAASMLASAVVRGDGAPVVGASGLVAGLAGATLALELHAAHRLPAWWRIPRRPFLILLGVQVVLDAAIPWIAGEAHAGGFVAGYAAAWAMADPALRRRAPGRATKAVALAVGALTLASLAQLGALVGRDAGSLASHGRRLLAQAEGLPSRDNHVAWLLATESDADAEALRVAVALAERAVDDTGRENPDLLDTLAEALFALGDRDRALAVIDEAIAIAPFDDYFREQRRRFTGERAAEDRPEPPEGPWFQRRPPELHPQEPPTPELTI